MVLYPLFFGGGGAGSPCNTMWPESRHISIPSGILIHQVVWPQQTWAENWEGAVLLWGGGAGSPSNTVWPGMRPTSMLSFILIYPTIWPQHTNVADRQRDRTNRQTQDNGPKPQGEPFYKQSPKNTCFQHWKIGNNYQIRDKCPFIHINSTRLDFLNGPPRIFIPIY